MTGRTVRTAISIWILALVVGASGQVLGAQKKVLDNGLTVILERNESSANTILQILIKGGMRAEPPAKRGLAFLTTRLSIEIPDSGKAQQLISLATRFSAFSRGDHSIINIGCLSANLEPSLKVLSKIFLDPLFSGIRIDSIKRYMEHQAKLEEDNSVRLGHLTSLEALFPGSGYGGSPYGDQASLEAIKNSEVSEFYRSHFVGPKIILSFVSDLPEETLLDLVDRYFAGLPSGKSDVLAPLAHNEPKEKEIRLKRDTKQAFISLAYRLPATSRRNYAFASLLECLLGKGQGSRLWALRAEMKLAYNVDCHTTHMREGALIEAYLETDAAKREAAREALRTVLDGLYRDGTNEEELLSAKNAAKTNFIRDHETKAAQAGILAFFEASGLGLDFFSSLLSEIDALTLEEVNATIKEFLAPEKALEVTIGPISED